MEDKRLLSPDEEKLVVEKIKRIVEEGNIFLTQHARQRFQERYKFPRLNVLLDILLNVHSIHVTLDEKTGLEKYIVKGGRYNRRLSINILDDTIRIITVM